MISMCTDFLLGTHPEARWRKRTISGLHLRIWGDMGRIAKQAVALGLSRTLSEKFGSRFLCFAKTLRVLSSTF
jgi:hypothetical protein